MSTYKVKPARHHIKDRIVSKAMWDNGEIIDGDHYHFGDNPTLYVAKTKIGGFLEIGTVTNLHHVSLDKIPLALFSRKKGWLMSDTGKRGTLVDVKVVPDGVQYETRLTIEWDGGTTSHNVTYPDDCTHVLADLRMWAGWNQSFFDHIQTSLKAQHDMIDTIPGKSPNVPAPVVDEVIGLDTAEALHEFTVSVTLLYRGDRPETSTVRDLVQSTMDHCRQEGMLSEPEWETISCEEVICVTLE